MAGETSKKSAEVANKAATKRVDARIKELLDWRVEVLSRIRRLIEQADPDVVEEVKWRKPDGRSPGVVP